MTHMNNSINIQTLPNKSKFLSDKLQNYLVNSGPNLDSIQLALIKDTREQTDMPMMQISPEQGALLTILTKATNVRNALEIGTFTGYSALCIARGLDDNARLTCCEINDEWIEIAKPHWEKAKIDHKIDVRIGDALTTLRAMPMKETYDLAFIDADKDRYPDYVKEIIPRLKPNALLLADNTLLGGSVASESESNEGVVKMREFNRMLATDESMEIVIVPIGDGLSIACKK